MAKKQNKCENCKFYDGVNCFHYTNIGVHIQYRQEEDAFLNPPEVINDNGKCMNYDRA